MKLSKLTLLFLFICSACSDKRLVIHHLLESETQNVERKLASDVHQKICQKNTFTKETLQAEVAELERPYLDGEKVQGEWKHLNLSELKIPEANFLLTYGEEIGDIANPDRVSFQGCRDLVCIFNRIYGPSEEMAGLVHYLWYLKFGHMLSLDNHVPRQRAPRSGVFNDKEIPFENYLFNSNELYGLWRLTHMLKAPHDAIAGLRQIQRVPRGEKLEESEFRGACGLSSGAGWIKLTDKCLELNDEGVGQLYQQMVHEMSHHIDYEEGRRLYQASHRSHQKDYLKVSGFYLFEYQKDNGDLERSWKRKNFALPSAYAGVSPQENFAEALSWFRIDGDFAKEHLPAKQFSFVSKNYYERHEFNKSSLAKKWLIAEAPELNRLAAQVYNECEGKKNCFEARYEETEGHIRNRIMSREPEGCSVFSDQDIIRKFKNDLKIRWKASWQTKGLARDEARSFLAAESFVQCYEESSDCYKNEIIRALGADKGRVYLGMYPLQDTQERILKSYKNLLSGKLRSIRERTSTLWRDCSVSSNDNESPTGDYFLLNEGYLVSSIYNCLNASLPSALEDFLRGMSVSGEKEKLILNKLLLAEFVKNLKTYYVQDRNSEAVRARNCLPSELRFHLKKDFPTSRACNHPRTQP